MSLQSSYSPMFGTLLDSACKAPSTIAETVLDSVPPTTVARTVLDSAPPTMAGTFLANLPHPPAAGTMLDLVFYNSAQESCVATFLSIHQALCRQLEASKYS